jgi:hypothetical protein
MRRKTLWQSGCCYVQLACKPPAVLHFDLPLSACLHAVPPRPTRGPRRAGEWQAVSALLHAPLPVLRSGMLPPAPPAAAPPPFSQSAPAALGRPPRSGPGPETPCARPAKGAAAGAAGPGGTLDILEGGALAEHLERLLLEAVASGCASSARDVKALLRSTLAWRQARPAPPARWRAPSS